MPLPPTKPQALASLTGIVARIVFRNPDSGWTVLKLETEDGRTVGAVGRMPGVQVGEALRLDGRWQRDPKYGRQFRIDSYSSLEPTSLEGLERFLGSGSLPGVGPATAKRIVRRFGESTLELLDNEPERLVEINGIGKIKVARIAKAWKEQRLARDALIFLQQHDVSAALAVRIVRHYGNASISVAKSNPYRLAEDVSGVGFNLADRLAQKLGLGHDTVERAAAGLLFALRRASADGHTYLGRDDLLERAAAMLELDVQRLRQGLGSLAERGAVIQKTARSRETVALAELSRAETAIAKRLLRIHGTVSPAVVSSLDGALEWWRKRQGLDLAPAQESALRQALSQKVMVLTGGPGTGKTTLLKGILDIFERKQQRVLLAAPTGRAANRLSEATGSTVKTVHRLLEFDPHTMRFRRDRQLPLKADLVVVDEASMLDVPLTYALLQAVPDRARLLLVGDVDQLPSVGPGKVLQDIIASEKLPVARLEEIFRQAEASRIVVNAHRIRRGLAPIDERVGADSDFFFIQRDEPEEVLRTLKKLVSERIPRQFGLDPKRAIQVLTPMRRGLLGTDNLNRELQALLNPAQSPARDAVGPRFRPADRVMQIRNNYDLDVFNGDIGTVLTTPTNGSRITVAYDGRRVDYEGPALEELVLAYACTVHKSQGSEYPCVVIPVHTQHFVMLQRNLIYTAVTRARKLVVLVGQMRALRIAVSTRKEEQRQTSLAAEIASSSPFISSS
ncbi:MAG: ATP-dependent RecD-like DNA helicase [bacterium]|nr:ATP-dependent RecD-like DNA helicase [bacterium]